jgi:hypothetical protein
MNEVKAKGQKRDSDTGKSKSHPPRPTECNHTDGPQGSSVPISFLKVQWHRNFDASKEVGLEINAERTTYISLFRSQNVGLNHDIKIANRSFENMAQFRYVGTTVLNPNLIQEEIKMRLNSGNAYYHSVQNLWVSRLLSKNVKIGMHKTIILPVVLYGCETWSLRLWEEHRLRVF